MVSNATGVIAAPSNFFAANSNLLNQALGGAFAVKTNAVLYGATNGATGLPLADTSVTNGLAGINLVATASNAAAQAAIAIAGAAATNFTGQATNGLASLASLPLGFAPNTPSPFTWDSFIRAKLVTATNLAVLGDSTAIGWELQVTNANWPVLLASNNNWTLTNYAGASRCLMDMQPFAWNLAYTNGGVIADVIGINDYRNNNPVSAWQSAWLGQVCLMELGTNKIAATNAAQMSLTGMWYNAPAGGYLNPLQSTAMAPPFSGAATATCTIYGSDVIIGTFGFYDTGCFFVSIDGTNFGAISNGPTLYSLSGVANSPNAFIFTNLPLGLHTVVLTSSNTTTGTLWLDYVASSDMARWQSPVILAGNIIMPTNFSSGGSAQLIQAYNQALYQNVQLLRYVGFPVTLNDISSALEPLTNSAANLYNDNLHPGLLANQIEAAVFEASANTRIAASNLTGALPPLNGACLTNLQSSNLAFTLTTNALGAGNFISGTNWPVDFANNFYDVSISNNICISNCLNLANGLNWVAVFFRNTNTAATYYLSFAGNPTLSGGLSNGWPVTNSAGDYWLEGRIMGTNWQAGTAHWRIANPNH